MKIKAITFTRDMASAIRRGKKTMTRRKCAISWHGCVTGDCPHERQIDCEAEIEKYFPYADVVVAVAVWGTEKRFDDIPPRDLPANAKIWTAFQSDEPPRWCGRMRPGRFMTKAMRSHCPQLRIKAKRVEHIKDISVADALAEGVELFSPHQGRVLFHVGDIEAETAVLAFAGLIEEIHGEEFWDNNEYVWAITFEVASGL
ncbi:MAG TPA: hypothetical protein VK176_00200 [Phycisphaerales bacterium]|nr:hypothetical protein [Phycisphaerales bacterium]